MQAIITLMAGSPAIDSANSNAPNQPATDLDGKARVDIPGVVNTGAGTRTYDDRGAYEYQIPPIQNLTVLRDGTGSGTVTSLPAGIDCGEICTFDFALLHLRHTDGGCPAELNSSPAGAGRLHRHGCPAR